MEIQDILNSKAVKAFIKGLLVIIGLFGVLYCSIATLLLLCGENLGNKGCALIFALTIPLIVLLIFLLVVFCFINKKLCGSSKYKETLLKMYKEEVKNEANRKETLLKLNEIEVVGEACLIVAKAIKPDSEKNVQALKELLEKMFALLLGIN